MERGKRKEYKRRWMAAARSLHKSRNEADTISSDDEVNTEQGQGYEVVQSTSSCDNTGPSSCFESPVLQVATVETDEIAQDNISFCNSYFPDKETDLNTVDNFCISNDVEILSSDSDLDGSLSCNLLANDLSQWVNAHSIDHNAADSLLRVLRKHGHSYLPMTARTLMGTAKTVETEIKSGMQYIYFEIEKQLRFHIRLYPHEILKDLTTFSISLNIDGLPLFKSTSASLWPVICSINTQPIKLFPLALTLGNTKPTDLEFLRDTIRDLNILLINGLRFEDRVINVKLKCIICDAPARAFVKAIKLYSGYYGCDRCDQRGRWIGRMTYPNVVDFNVRTDQTFRNRENDEHHHDNLSPFCGMQVYMIKQFPLDYMHQICLGAMKKLLLLWKRGKKRTQTFGLSNFNNK